jgi:hypothetical protein
MYSAGYMIDHVPHWLIGVGLLTGMRISCVMVFLPV